MPILATLRTCLRAAEDWWFDVTRNVSTRAAGVAQSVTVGDRHDSYGYLPARSANARAAIRSLPVRDLSRYTFIDVGSGKGRVLFIAAEFPFSRILGVEFDPDLHAAARRNIKSFRNRRRRSMSIESVLENAADYRFPHDPLVLCLFNPFGPQIMSRMLDNLERSLAQHPRHVLLIMLWPQHGDIAVQRCWLREVERTRRHRIFAAAPAAA